MIRRFAIFVPALALALTAAPGTARAADSKGDKGVITEVEVNTPSSDAYLQYHGRVVIKAGSRSTEYRWGGTSCGSRTLSPDNINLLVSVGSDRLQVKPRFQNGQAGAKCLVGFTVSGKSNNNGKSKPKPR